MNEAEYQRLMETAWKRPLLPEEEAHLKAWLDRHPETTRVLDEEVQLTRLLNGLPNVPVSSNFTAQVLLALDQELKAPATRSITGILPRLVRAWLPRVAVASVVLALGGAFYWNQEQHRQAKLAQSLNIASTMSVLPAPQALQDFEVINQLTAVGPVSSDLDLELLAALE